MYILGDINICAIHKHSLYKKYFNVLNLFNLTQLINTPTRVTDKSSSALDHIITNSMEKICQFGTLALEISDHDLVYCTRKIVKGQVNRHHTVKIRSLKNYSKELLVEELSKTDWSDLSECLCVNIMWTKLKTRILNVLNKIAPIKEVRLKTRTEPWM